MHLVSWNVNSIKARLEHLEVLSKEYSPDVILLQETKSIDENFPYEFIEDLGYNVVVSGQKSYNGVAILSKSSIEDIIFKLPYDDTDDQARYIEGVTKIGTHVFRVASVYVPNGSEVGSEKFEYKMKFFNRLSRHIETLLSYEENTLIGGDYNVAPEEIDVYDPKKLSGKIGFHIDERKKLREILNLGYKDSFRLLKNHEQAFSWWDYRSGSWDNNKGMRIDHILLSPKCSDLVSDAGIYSKIRGMTKPSDHAPIFIKCLSE